MGWADANERRARANELHVHCVPKKPVRYYTAKTHLYTFISIKQKPKLYISVSEQNIALNFIFETLYVQFL
jgi:hypothetical protein